MAEHVDEEIVWEREVAAVVALVVSAVGLALSPLVPVLGLLFGVVALNAGGWAAARGEHAAIATLGIVLGLAAVGGGVFALVR